MTLNGKSFEKLLLFLPPVIRYTKHPARLNQRIQPSAILNSEETKPPTDDSSNQPSICIIIKFKLFRMSSYFVTLKYKCIIYILCSMYMNEMNERLNQICGNKNRNFSLEESHFNVLYII